MTATSDKIAKARRAKLAQDVAAHYRRTGTLVACSKRFRIARAKIHTLLEEAGQPLALPAFPGARPLHELSGFLRADQKRLGGHDRARAICANLSERGLSPAQIAETTGFSLVAVEHHLEHARLRARQPTNGKP